MAAKTNHARWSSKGLFPRSPRALIAVSLALFTRQAGAVTMTDSFYQNSELTTAGNYTNSLPSNATDVLLTTPSTGLTITTSSLAMESLSATDGFNYSIAGAGTPTNGLTLGNSSGFTNAYSGAANDLIYLAGNSTLAINAGPSTLGLTLASTGNFNVGAGSTLTIASAITGASGIALTATGAGSVTLSGSLANYLGTIGASSGGTLNLSQATGTDTLFAAASGGGFGGNLIITTAIRVNFDSGLFSGGGQIQIQATGTTLSNSSTAAGPGTVSNAIALNSKGSSFTAGNVAASTYTPGNFVATIGGTTSTNSTSPVIFSGVISGGSDVNIANSATNGGGSGPISLGLAGTKGVGGASGYETYTGNTTINSNNATITLLNSNVFPTTTDVIDGTINTSSGNGLGKTILNLNGFNQQIGSISDGQYATATAHTLTITNTGSSATLTVGDLTTPAKGFSGAITDGGTASTLALIKTGTDTISLTGANNKFSGGVTVNQGTLIMTGTNTDATGTGAVIVNPTGDTGTSSDAATLSTNNSAIGNSGALFTVNSSSTVATATGTINFTSGSPAIGSLSGNGNVVLQNSSGTNLTIGFTNNLSSTFTGAISEANAGGGSLTKAGTGMLTLSGTSSYTGATTINAGALIINGSISSMTGGVSVATSGTLGGSGSVGGATTVNAGGTITGGTVGTVGTLTFSKGLTISGTYIADLIGGSGTGTGSDTLSLTGGSGVGVLNLNNTSTLSLSVQGTPTASQYVLAAYASLNGTFNTVNNVPSGYTLDYGTVTPGEITLDMSSVPEPATWFSGLVLLGTTGYSQRRRFQGLLCGVGTV